MNNISLEKGDTVFLAIDSNFTVKVFMNFDKVNNNVDTVIAKVSCSKVHTTHWGNKYNLIDSTFIDNQQNEVVISRNKWSINSTKDGFFGSNDSFYERECWGAKIPFILEDPLGECRRIVFPTKMYNIDESTPVECLKFLNELSSLNNWTEYDLKCENDLLKEENETLKKELERLKKK